MPTDAHMCKVWVTEILKVQQLFNVTKSTMICSKHFEKEDYRYNNKTCMLNTDAFPSIFLTSKIFFIKSLIL